MALMEEEDFKPRTNSCTGCWRKFPEPSHDQMTCNMKKYENALVINEKTIDECRVQLMNMTPENEEYEYFRSEIEYAKKMAEEYKHKILWLKKQIRRRDSPPLLFR